METLLIAQSSGGGGGGMFGLLFNLAVITLVLASMWRVFAKAEQPGWACLVPILNIYTMCKIAGRPGWWTLLCFVPIVNIAIFAVLSLDIARSFGKSAGFGVGLFLLGIVFYPILAFGSAEYIGDAGGDGGPQEFGDQQRPMAA